MSSASDDELDDATLALADELLRAALARRVGPLARRQERLRALLSTESGTRLVFSLADRVLRPVSARVGAGELTDLARAELAGLSGRDRVMLRAAALAGHVAPGPVVGLATRELRAVTRPFVAPLEQRALSRYLARLSDSGRRANLNVLGEAVLGDEEAERRHAAVAALLARDDVECVSVKVSSIAAGLSLFDFEGSLARAAEPLRSLYRAAAPGRKLVNLDMEEHRDLDLTLALFMRVLGEPEFAHLVGGIALQAYVPDTHAALDELLAYARLRRAGGGAPIRVRLVKGANLATELAESEIRGFPSPVYSTKAETDASYKALLERLVQAAAAGLCTVGVASHNLFDIALGLVLSRECAGAIEVEMLAGMADDQVGAVAERVGDVLVYVPATARRDFRNAVAYLTRRLDENATPEGFLRHALSVRPDGPEWRAQADRFSQALRARTTVSRDPRQAQDRGARGDRAAAARVFVNEPDTDLSVRANRIWAAAVLRAPAPVAPARASWREVESAIGRARLAAARRGADLARRRALLGRVAEVMAERRAEAIASMVHEAGKTFAEADPEVSEAIDFARYYAFSSAELEDATRAAVSEPLGVVVVAPPWNFPYAIPSGGVCAALATGNAVILKPSPEARATAGVLVAALHAAGFDDDEVQLVATDDDEAGRLLVTHRDVGGVVLTGSYATATTLSGWAPHLRLLAETSGKNAIVVAASADVDLAVREIVRSAFGHAGQKCSAASLAIVDASIYDRSSFLRQLADATRSLRVGAATDPATDLGPIVGPMTVALERALCVLDPGESWLVEPREISARLFSPGVRIGVRRGGFAHQTEWFGPVLAVMRARGFDEALAMQNEVAFGLTAGLHSLDPREHERFVEEVQAGNLYVNRHITGAIVSRQPFGGWKRSSLGPTAKAGGPNYLIGLRRFRDRATVPVEEARLDYERALRGHFSVVHELAGLNSESNELRYRAFSPGVRVRVGDATPADAVPKAAAAAALCGTPVRFSCATSRRDLEGAEVAIESAEQFAAGLSGFAGRLRLLGTPEPTVLAGAAAAGVSVYDEPICSLGRVELVRWLREQSIARSLHRYGSIVYPRLVLGGATRFSRRPE